MALSQSLSTGITGLMTHQKAMDNIGNNLANVNTVGFKKGVYQFSTLLEQSLRGGMTADSSTGRGSVNPIALGLGAQTGSINKVFTQGPLENTGNPNDMAINGNGFFVLRQDNGFVYTRAGSFYRGEDGSLMAGAGLYVQGTMAVKGSNGNYSIPQDARLQNIIIPIGSTGGHAQTSQVQFTGNLDSRQELSNGTQLFGGTSFPTVNSLQKWMNPTFNGGDRATDPSVDDTWNSLEEKTYRNLFDENTGASLFSPLPSYIFYALDRDGNVKSVGEIETTAGSGVFFNVPEELDTILAATLTPKIEEIKTINGGNVVTSAAYGVKAPAYISSHPTTAINNQYTFPPEFYSETGAAMLFEDVAAMTDTEVLARLNDIWPNGINGMAITSMPHPGETYPASLNTPLENLYYLKGNVWVQPFANIKNGDEINVGFTKGNSQLECTFVYNRPVGSDPLPGQTALNREQSFTLAHFLTFLGGDVDEPSVAAANISPEMFGYPAVGWDQSGYEKALANVSLAKSDSNLDSTGGAMGLLSIPPQISDGNFGDDRYDAPLESGGAYSRTGVQQVYYDRWNGTTWETVKSDSFNTSFVSNLGSMNALSDLRITYNNVPHDSMYGAETEYNAPQGGSSTVTVDFYDSLGNPKSATLNLALVEQDDNFTTWRWYADCVDDTDFQWQADPSTGELTTNLNVGTGLIRFDKNGNFVKGAEFSESQGISINQSNQGVNQPIWISLLNGLSSGSTQDLDFSELTCSATANGFKLAAQNGRPPGTLNDFTVSLDGTIQGIYSNGNVVELARIGLALFPNENGLVAAGSDLFYAGPASGSARYGHANTGGSGQIHHKQLESSNVDLSEEFTKLISIERGFQANSRTITTADEMITELLNLKR